MRISDWSSDVCSSDLADRLLQPETDGEARGARKDGERGQVDAEQVDAEQHRQREQADRDQLFGQDALRVVDLSVAPQQPFDRAQDDLDAGIEQHRHDIGRAILPAELAARFVEKDCARRMIPGEAALDYRSEEHTSALQSLMRSS